MVNARDLTSVRAAGKAYGETAGRDMLSRRRDGRWRNSGRVRCPRDVEEVGIDPESIRIVNRLDTIYTYSNFAMYCYLGIVEETALK